MNAYVLHETMQLEKEERNIPTCGENEVLLRVTHCGICRTDRKAWQMGQKDLHMPRVLGHEIVGIAEDVGTGTSAAMIGKRFVLHPGVFCGTCGACQSGRDQLCKDMKIIGFHLDGGFAEYCLVPARAVQNGNLILIPDELPSETAALAEPLACAVNLTESMPHDGTNLLLFGGGALGVLTALLWRKKGIAGITVIEPNAWKRQQLEALGFRTWETPEETNKRFDIAVNCCPDVRAMESALKLLKQGGTFGYFSGLTGDASISAATLNLIHYKELRIVGSYGCALHHTREAVRLLAGGAFDGIPTETIFPNELEAHLKQTEKENSIVTILQHTGR